MSCRSNPGNSAATSHARFATGLSDMQTLSTFHSLIREGETLNLAQPSPEEFDQWLSQTRARVQNEPSYDERRRQSLLTRLATVASSTPPNGATFYAWQNIEERSRQANTQLTGELTRLGNEMGVSAEQAREQFNRLRAQSDDERSLTAGSVFVDWERRVQQNAQNVASSGGTIQAVPRDRGTQYALAMLEQAALNARVQRVSGEMSGRRVATSVSGSSSVSAGQVAEPPPDPTTQANRETILTMNVAPGTITTNPSGNGLAPIRRQAVHSTYVLAVGYDAASRRLHVEYATGHIYEYSDVPADIYPRLMQSGHRVGSLIYYDVRQAGYAFRQLHPDEVAAQDTALANPTPPANSGTTSPPTGTGTGVVNCPSCGQFMPRDGSPHACPVLAGTFVAATGQEVGRVSVSGSGEYQFSANPTVTEESLSRALDRASYGNVTSEQLQTLQHADVALLSPPPADYAVTAQTSTYSAYPTTLTAPSAEFVRQYAEVAQLGPGAQFYIYAGAAMGDSPATVEGPVRLEVGANGAIRLADSSGLMCNSCGQSGVSGGHACRDIGRVINDLYTRYNPTVQRPPNLQQNEQGQTRLMAFVASDRLAADEARAEAIRLAAEAAERTRQEQEQAQEELALAGNYATNMSAFQQAYEAAKARKSRGEAAIPYLTENATGGLGARSGGRGFGIEMEFDLSGLPYPAQQQALVAIGRDLHSAGITRTAAQQRYHSSTDYSQWRFEQDGTVSGEIISPILYDEPESWEQIARVCEIVKQHGGQATARTGGHVHVACGNYNHTPRNHNNLLRLFKRSEDVLYRLAQNPQRNRHRGTSWCRPNTLLNRDYTSVNEVHIQYNSHHVGLNFQAVEGRASDHVEYRMWDGTLDPAAIQSQIKVSLAMTEAAYRAEEGAFRGEEETLGSHRATSRANATSRRRLTGDAWQEDTTSFRTLVDTLFTRPEDKEQVTALFAVTKWQG